MVAVAGHRWADMGSSDGLDPAHPPGLSRRSAGGSHPAPSRAITSGHQRPHTTEPHDSTAGFDRVSEGATVLPHTLRVAGAVIGAGCSGCDWGQGDRRSSAGQPAERPTGGQSPRSSSPRPCRTWGGGYRASSAVSGDGRRTACRLTRFDSVRAVIDLWAQGRTVSAFTRNGSGRADGDPPTRVGAVQDLACLSPRRRPRPFPEGGMAGTPTTADRPRPSCSQGRLSAVRDLPQSSRGSAAGGVAGSAELTGSSGPRQKRASAPSV